MYNGTLERKGRHRNEESFYVRLLCDATPFIYIRHPELSRPELAPSHPPSQAEGQKRVILASHIAMFPAANALIWPSWKWVCWRTTVNDICNRTAIVLNILWPH